MPSTWNKNDSKTDDLPTIDKWKTDPFTPSDNLGGTFAEESSFGVLFPKYREVYLKEAWPLVTRSLAKHGIACELDLVSGTMTVRTTRKTYDPAAILNARDCIKLLSRSVPAPQAVKILDDDNCFADIIKIRTLVSNKDRFVKRRQRILGPNGTTLKALELLTTSYILVQGNTVCAMGPPKGLKEIRRVVEDCMHNVHPIYHIKEMMIKRELAKDPELANESWERFLPHFKRRSLSKRMKPRKVRDTSGKGGYEPFPPPRELSKVDLQIESGEYFLGKQAKERARKEERVGRQRERQVEKKRQRESAFVPPKEVPPKEVVEGGEGERERKRKKRNKHKEKRGGDEGGDVK